MAGLLAGYTGMLYRRRRVLRQQTVSDRTIETGASGDGRDTSGRQTKLLNLVEGIVDEHDIAVVAVQHGSRN